VNVIKVTTVNYMYRDGSNYKAWAEVQLAGAITEEQRESVRQSLDSVTDDHTDFIPAQIGWGHAGEAEDAWNSFPDNDDHCWHELDVADGITVHDWFGPAPEQTVEDWVTKMTAAGAAGWDDITYGIGA